MRLLDEFLPQYDVRSRYARQIDAPPEAVADALRALDLRELRLTGALMELRGLPKRLTGQGRLLPRNAKGLDAMLEAGFALLGERELEVALGTVGEFWRPVSQPTAPASPEEFAAFDRPGYAKGAIDFMAVPLDGGSVLTTETRVLACDDAARRSFMRYWRLISLGSGLIRHELMGAVAKRAEGG